LILRMVSLAKIFPRKLFCWWLLTMIKHLIVSRDSCRKFRSLLNEIKSD
jgi:hypothetical protein